MKDATLVTWKAENGAFLLDIKDNFYNHISCCLLLENYFYFEMILNLQKTYKNSTYSLHVVYAYANS